MEQVSEKVVITGASSRFGEGALRALADRVYRVWGTVRGVEGCNGAERGALTSHSPNIAIVEMDVLTDKAAST